MSQQERLKDGAKTVIKDSALRKERVGRPTFHTDSQADHSRLEDALRTLYELLEEYAPSWYTRAHHDKAATALGIKDDPCSRK